MYSLYSVSTGISFLFRLYDGGTPILCDCCVFAAEISLSINAIVCSIYPWLSEIRFISPDRVQQLAPVLAGSAGTGTLREQARRGDDGVLVHIQTHLDNGIVHGADLVRSVCRWHRLLQFRIRIR